MKLTQLRDLIAIAEKGGLRRAARHLGLTQPAVTRSIRELEQELGAPLFQRNATGMTLTPVGQAFLRRSQSIQRELDRACDEVRQLTGINAGQVAIGLATAPHVSMLPRVLEPFRRRYPQVLLRIFEGLFPAMEAEIRNGAIDFYVGPLSEDKLSTEFSVERLLDNMRVVMCRAGHPLREARTLRQLAHAEWVATSVTADQSVEIHPLFKQLGLPEPRIAVQTRSGLSMIAVAASSDLLALLPQQWLHFARTTGLLDHIDIEDALPAPAICVVSRSSLPLTPAAQHLCDLIRRAALNAPLSGG